MQTVATIPRLRLAANRSREHTLTVPSTAFTQVRVRLDLADADQLDPTAWLKLTLNVSLDGGATWVFYGSCTTWGSNTPERQAMLLDPETNNPWMQVPIPPAGSRLRGTIETGAKALDIGLIIEVL